jgi:hypothetical protein
MIDRLSAFAVRVYARAPLRNLVNPVLAQFGHRAITCKSADQEIETTSIVRESISGLQPPDQGG